MPPTHHYRRRAIVYPLHRLGPGWAVWLRIIRQSMTSRAETERRIKQIVDDVWASDYDV